MEDGEVGGRGWVGGWGLGADWCAGKAPVLFLFSFGFFFVNRRGQLANAIASAWTHLTSKPHGSTTLQQPGEELARVLLFNHPPPHTPIHPTTPSHPLNQSTFVVSDLVKPDAIKKHTKKNKKTFYSRKTCQIQSILRTKWSQNLVKLSGMRSSARVFEKP